MEREIPIYASTATRRRRGGWGRRRRRWFAFGRFGSLTAAIAVFVLVLHVGPL